MQPYFRRTYRQNLQLRSKRYKSLNISYILYLSLGFVNSAGAHREEIRACFRYIFIAVKHASNSERAYRQRSIIFCTLMAPICMIITATAHFISARIMLPGTSLTVRRPLPAAVRPRQHPRGSERWYAVCKHLPRLCSRESPRRCARAPHSLLSRGEA